MSTPRRGPWWALWAMLVGFFMTLIDWTAVSVANPSIMAALHAGYESVIWVTSAYLLGFAVPLLVAGRLGDRFGPKNVYLVGLAIFTAASLWCGLSGSIADADRRARGPGPRRRVAHTTDVVDDHPHLPGGASRRRNEHLGHCRRRDAGGPMSVACSWTNWIGSGSSSSMCRSASSVWGWPSG